MDRELKAQLLVSQAKTLLSMSSKFHEMAKDWQANGAQGNRCDACGRLEFNDQGAPYFRNRNNSLRDKCLDVAKRMLTQHFELLGSDDPEEDAGQFFEGWLETKKRKNNEHSDT